MVELAGSLHSTCCHSAWLLISPFHEHNIHNLGQITYIGFVKAGQTKGQASRVCYLHRWPTLDAWVTYSCWCMDATSQESSQSPLRQTSSKCFQHSLPPPHFPHSLRTQFCTHQNQWQSFQWCRMKPLVPRRSHHCDPTSSV